MAIRKDEHLPELALNLLNSLGEEYEQLGRRIDEIEMQLIARGKADPLNRRLSGITGVGPIGAALLAMKTPAPHLFKSGRQFAAWIGLTPRDHSTVGRVRLGGMWCALAPGPATST